jgi:hypothetical protein
MRKIFVVALFALALGVLTASPADAYWTFLTYDEPTFAMCTGEPNYPYGDPSCDVTTTWGTRVQTHLFNGKCAATITCPNGLAKTCLAVEEGGGTPGDPWTIAMCWASTSQSGSHRAVCKSDLGWFSLSC